MSRIHEALKKAEQERAMNQPATRVETASSVLEPSTEPAGVMAAAVSAAIAAPAFTGESLLSRSRQTTWNPDLSKLLFLSGQEHAAGTEEFRTLRSRLYQLREKQAISKVLVSSALPKEGKSFTAANLAQVIVRQHGRRVVLIDADLRNPQVHRLFGAEPGPGLSDYLAQETDEYSILQRGMIENLFLIPAGRMSANPAELLANGRMKTLLSRLEQVFDWVIIDSPPAVPVADATIIAKDCDGVLLVVRSNSTPVDAARRARKEFADRNVLGVVLNGITPELAPYTQYYYSAYGSQAMAESKN